MQSEEKRKDRTNKVIINAVLVDVNKLPQLYSYSLQCRAKEITSLAHSLAYWLAQKTNSIWVWDKVHNLFVTNADMSDSEVDPILQSICEKDPSKYALVDHISRIGSTDFSLEVISNFAAKYIWQIAHQSIEATLKKYDVLIPTSKQPITLRIRRRCKLNGIVIDDSQPAVSFDVFSSIEARSTVADLLRHGVAIDDLMPSLVRDPWNDFVASITGVLGPMRDHRERLISRSTTPALIECLNKAPDDELVVTIATKKQNYDYPTSALLPVYSLDQIRTLFDSSTSTKVHRECRLSPDRRFAITNDLKQTVEETIEEDSADNVGIIGSYVSSLEYDALFYGPTDYDYPPLVVFGNGVKATYSSSTVIEMLSTYGLYKQPYTEEERLIIGVCKTFEDKEDKVKKLISELLQMLRQLHVPVKFKVLRDSGMTSSQIRMQVNTLIDQGKANFILGVLPERDISMEVDFYHTLKVQCSNVLKIPSQAICADSIDKDNIVYWNLLLSILAKAGCIPYVLDSALDDVADYFVAYDVGRKPKMSATGTINMGASAIVMRPTGELIYGSPYDKPIEGESIPFEMLSVIEGLPELRGTRVMFMRDGRFTRSEIDSLQEITTEMNITPVYVNVIKSSNERLFAQREMYGTRIENPKKATVFKQNSHEALLITTQPSSRIGTAQPLRVSVFDPEQLDNAIKAVLNLTVMNYYTLNVGKLPLPNQVAHVISNAAVNGINTVFRLREVP